MTKEEIITAAAREIIVESNMDAIPNFFSSSYVAHASGKSYKGHKFLERWSAQMKSAFNHMSVERIAVIAESDNTITWLRTLSAVSVKKLKGIPPSNKKIHWTEMVVSRIDKDLICEEWVVSELLGQMLLAVPKQNLTNAKS